ncbi:Hypothetical predicted protein [Pelobates cultripes]|uniref:Beta/gamma crystallin 'Greek key' domain-containing protein n=1 Tax=Pelobates cultripes TaxID=61616 RepID=A0AAD1VTA0_PELCU|nr:Hypothetical predicted protein [Pelobates cultripes]
MEKEKKGSFLGLGKFFSKNRTDEKCVNGSTKEAQQSSTQGEDEVVERPSMEQPAPGGLPSPGEHPTGEYKKRSFGSWRSKKRRSLASTSTSPTSSPGPLDSSDRHFEIPDGDQDVRPYSMIVTSQPELEVTHRKENEPNLILDEHVDKSKTQAAESPRKDSTRKPVLGKIGSLFNTSKRRQNRSLSDSPTSPTGPFSKANEKETPSERRRNQVSSPTDSKVPSQPSKAARLGNPSEHISEEQTSESWSEKEITNGESANGFSNQSNLSIKETESPNGPASDTASGSNIKPLQSPSPKASDKQNVTERNVKPLAPSPGRRNSATEGEATKITSKKLQVFSQDININKEESPKILSKKSTKFSGKLSDSKVRGQDKPVQASDKSEASNTTKLSSQAVLDCNTKEQTTLSPELSNAGETANGNINLNKVQATGDSSPGKNSLRGSPQEKLKTNGANDSALNSKVLAFEIYLSKPPETSCPTTPEAYSNGESMESSPSYKRSGKKRRSLKSQSSQNGEKKADCVSPQEQGLDSNFTFEGVTESPATPEQKTRPVPLSPEANGMSSANQDSKAGANRKLSPKGETDKDKQQHPASSYLRKKKDNHSASSVPASPTARKTQAKDSLFRNPLAAPVRTAEGSQTVPVSTTKDSCVEKQSLGSPSGNIGEDCVARSCENKEECTALAAGALPEDKQQGSSQGVPNESLQAKAGRVTPTAQSPVDLDVTTLKTTLKENTRSTVTSKLNIPPKPKNVELPIKPKFSENTGSTQEPATEQIIQRGSIANKISLFENKTTTHKQIDFPATKSITQPKKFVERAKLNFGKQTKRPVQKYHISPGKQTSDFRRPDIIKAENGTSEIKVESDTTQAERDNNKVEPAEKDTVTVERQMEDVKHGLDTVVVPSDAKEESVEHSLDAQSSKENIAAEKECLNTDLNSFEANKSKELSENIESLSVSPVEDNLLHLPRDPALHSVGDTTPYSNNTISEEGSLPDMGNVNKNNSSKGKAREVESENISGNDSSSIPSDIVDSSGTSTFPSTAEQGQSNDSTEVNRVESESQSLQSVKSIVKSRTNETEIVKSSSKESPKNIPKNKNAQETIPIADTIPNNFQEQGSVKGEEKETTLKQTDSLPEVEATQCSVRDTQEIQAFQTVVKGEDYLDKNEQSSSPSTDGTLNSTKNTEDVGESSEKVQIPTDQDAFDFTQGPLLSLVENTSALKEENALSESDRKESLQEFGKASQTQENALQVLTSIQKSDETSADSLEKTHAAHPPTSEIIPCLGRPVDNSDKSQDTQNTILENGVNEIAVSPTNKIPCIGKPVDNSDKSQDIQNTILETRNNEVAVSTEATATKPSVSELKDNENVLEARVGVEIQQQQKDNSPNILGFLTKADGEGFSEATVDVNTKQSKKTERVEPQVVKFLNEVDGRMEEYLEKYSAKSSSSTEMNAEDPNNTVNESDQGWATVNPYLPESVNHNGYVADTAQGNGSPQKTMNPEQYCKNIENHPETALNASVASDEGTLDSSADMEKFAETIRKLESPVTLPQKRKKNRAPKSPGPYCGLPPIREDYLEKILDGDSFSFGLGKKDRAKDMAPMALFKLQSRETAEKMLPKRASAEQSMLLKSLKSNRQPIFKPQETCDKDNADVTDLAVKRSRIESMYTSLKTPSAARSEENVFSPSVTTINTITTSFATPQKECAQTGKNFETKMTDSAKTAQSLVNESEKDIIKSNGTLAQDYLNSPQTDSAEQPQSRSPSDIVEKQTETNSVSQAKSQLSELKLSDRENSLDINTSLPGGNRMALPPFQSTSNIEPLNGEIIANDVPEIFYFKGHEPNSAHPNLVTEGFPGQGVDKINPRPGKLVILTEAEGEGSVIEVYSDEVDCTSWELTPHICIKTIRGCWIIYELPNFQGRSIALEEGDLELANPWAEEPQEESTPSPIVLGSLRHVVQDYRVCQIDLFTEPDGLGIMTSYFDDTEELQVYGRLQRTCSIRVHWGVWLIYEESGFQGIPYIIEPGEYPNLSFWNADEAFIGSMRPLKMGSRKVEIPYDPKIIIYEKPLFEGRNVEFEKEILKLEDLGSQENDGEETLLPFSTAGSLRVLSGLWVGYEKPGFEGHQYLLEEGDYEDWRQWGGFNGLLQSLRPILSDFSASHMTMYSEKDFDEKGPNINVLGIISNMEETGYGLRTQSVNVLSGVWVAYETPDFTGEQYILEKGMYRNFSDWGAKNAKISSVQPIVLDAIENPRGGFKVALFSEPDFQGQVYIFEGDTKNIEDSFTARSCKVIMGRWAVYDKEDFSGNLWVLEEGNFTNLCAMGCQHDTVIRSLQMIKYEFSEPAILLYGKENYKGRKVKLTTETMSIQAIGYSPDLVSLEVLGGIWVLYEFNNYRGRQIFIFPGKIAQWSQFSGWERIGSLRPLRQKRLYFKLRNKASGMFMSTNGTLDDIKLLRIQVMEDTGAEDQIWAYQEGTFRCRIAEDCSLATSGSLVTAGSKLGLTLEQTGACMQWNINPDGRIYARSKSNLVLDIKGGNQYDQQHVILNTVTEGKVSQLWEVCVL